jgi:ATP synthase subunit 8
LVRIVYKDNKKKEIMPQLDIVSYFTTSIWFYILFITLLFIIHTYMLPKIARVLKLRANLDRKKANMAQKDEITINIDKIEQFVKSVIEI